MNLPEQRGFFPKVTTTTEQQDFVHRELIPELKRLGIIKAESWAEFSRVAIKHFSGMVGIDAVGIEMKSPGRKAKAAV